MPKYDFVFDVAYMDKINVVEIEENESIERFEDKVYVNLGLYDFVFEAGEHVVYDEPSGCPIMTFPFPDDDAAFDFSQAFNDAELEPWRIHLVRNLDTGKEYAAY